MTRSRSMCASPKLRSPGVSMTQPPSGSSSAIADDEVCRPRPVTALTPPVARPAPGTSALTRVDLPTPEWPTRTLTRSRRWVAQLVQRVLAVDHDVVDVQRAVGARAASRGDARSDLVRQSSGRSPASYAATRQRSISRGRGSGSASAVTMTSWSALATMTRSNGSVSSAVRRSVERARLDPHDPREGVRRPRHVADQRDPVADDDAPPAQLAGLHRRHLVAVDPAGAPPAVDGDDDADRGVVVGRPVLRAGPRPAAGPDPDVVLVQVRGRGWPGTPLTRASRSTGRRSRAASWRWSRRRRPGRRARTARGRPPSSPAGGRRTSTTTPPCSGRGRISSPSSVSRTSPPSAVISVASAASRSVSWWRRWAMPRSRDGPVASAATAASTGVELADVAEVEVDALDPGPVR